MLNFCTSFLTHTAVFEGIPAQEIDKAIACLHGFYKVFENGQEIYRALDVIRYAGIVITGCVHLEQIGVDGKVVLLKDVTRGELFGADLNCLHHANPFLRMVSIEKSKILFIKIPSAYDKTCCNCPYKMIVLENIFKEVARNTEYLTMKIQLLSQPSLRGKLLFYLHEMCSSLHQNSFTLPFTREKLAQFICADRSAVSRELCRMNSEGIIKIEGKKITLVVKENAL